MIKKYISMYKLIKRKIQVKTLRYIVKLLLRLIKYPNISEEEMYEAFLKFLGVKHIILTNSGREALYLALKALDIPKKSTVLLQSFTCIHVLNSIIRLGFTPMFLDTDPIFLINITARVLKNYLSKYYDKRIKAVILQYTYGYPVNVKEIKRICEEYNLYLIEDCAMALGVKIFNKMAGSYGDISIFSLTKGMFNIGGGFLCTNNYDIYKKAKEISFKEYKKILDTKAILLYIEKLRTSLFESYGCVIDLIEYLKRDIQKRRIKHIFENQCRPLGIFAKLAYIQLRDILHHNSKRRENIEHLVKTLPARVESIDYSKMLVKNSNFIPSYLYIPLYFKKRVSEKRGIDKALFHFKSIIRPWRPLHKSFKRFNKERLINTEYVYDHLLITPNSPFYGEEELKELKDILEFLA